MTVPNEGSSINYEVPPISIFDLVPYKNCVGEQVVCVDDYGSNKVKRGEIYTVTKFKNGHIWIDKFKDYQAIWFSGSRFKKYKAVYNRIEYTLQINVKERK